MSRRPCERDVADSSCQQCRKKTTDLYCPVDETDADIDRGMWAERMLEAVNKAKELRAQEADSSVSRLIRRILGTAEYANSAGTAEFAEKAQRGTRIVSDSTQSLLDNSFAAIISGNVPNLTDSDIEADEMERELTFFSDHVAEVEKMVGQVIARCNVLTNTPSQIAIDVANNDQTATSSDHRDSSLSSSSSDNQSRHRKRKAKSHSGQNKRICIKSLPVMSDCRRKRRSAGRPRPE